MQTVGLLGTSLLILCYIAGFTLYTTGLVRAKNSVDILVKNLSCTAIIILLYVFIGAHIVVLNKGTISILPHVQWLSETEFAALDPADLVLKGLIVIPVFLVVSAASAERLKLWSYLLFSIAAALIMLPILMFWVWGPSMLNHLGFVDQAGAGVLHLFASILALVTVLILGPRHQRYEEDTIMAPRGANLPLAAAGAWLMWWGFLGLHSGAYLLHMPQLTLSACAYMFLSTNVAIAASLLFMFLLTRIFYAKTDLTLLLNAVLVGAVVVSARPFDLGYQQAALMGAIASILVFFAVLLLEKLKIDDPTGSVPVFMIAGLVGLLSVNKPINTWNHTFLIQFFGSVFIILWAALGAVLLWWIVWFLVGMRVHSHEEFRGLDSIEHGMSAYPEFTFTSKQ